ncbi:MAG: hypothetical protein IKM98_06565 [Bacteroidales bacterium]|nr:hypothetical protein [Bacteroidales bacterium]
MKKKIFSYLFVAALLMSGIWPPGSREPVGKRIPIPGKPPIIVVFPGSK